jgi:uncharacterized protein (TIGR02996 family)
MIRRFELDDGSVTKFWEIESRDDVSFTCRWGKVGARGRNERNYAFGDAAAATKAGDKLIAEKAKAGFALASKPTRSAPAPDDETDDEVEDVPRNQAAKPTKVAKAVTPETWNRKLEALLADDPEDKATWQVYADWMLEHEQPWGEMIALACNGKPWPQRHELTKQLLGELDNSSIEWRFGTIDKVSLCPESEDDETRMVQALARILAHPAGRFVRELELGLPPNDDGDCSFDSVLKVLAKSGLLPLLRVVDMTPEAEHMDQESWRRIGDIRCLWKNAPSLRELRMRGSEGSGDGTPIKMGDIVAPRLEKFIYISSGLNKSVPIALGTATLPELEHLELYFGSDDYGNNCKLSSLAGILEGKGLPRLTYLGLENSEWETNLIEALAKAPVVKRLKTLDLSKGTLFRDGAAALIARADAFRHLEKLDLSDNYLEDEQCAAIKTAIPCAHVEGQREVDDWDGDIPYRYVSIGE